MKIILYFASLATVILFGTVSVAAPSEFPIARLKGLFGYHENFHVPQIRRAETINVSSGEGEARVKTLRSEGYNCIRKSQAVRLCSKVWTPDKSPEGLDKSVSKFMAPIKVEFSGDTNLPDLIHDGSTTQEWQVSERIKVINTELSIYRVIKNNKGQIYVAFPVSESQPMNPLLYHNENRLGLSIIANTKDTPTSTLAYTMEAFLEKAE